MLKCFLKFLRFKSFGVGSVGQNQKNYPDLAIPKYSKDDDNTFLIYDSVYALLEADILVYKRSKEIIEDFIWKFNSKSLAMVDSNHIPPRSFDVSHAFNLLASLFNEPETILTLSAKIELLFNIVESFSRSPDHEEAEDISISLATFFRTIYLSLIERYEAQFRKNLEYVNECKQNNKYDRKIQNKEEKINQAFLEIKDFYSKLVTMDSQFIRFGGEDLMEFAFLIEEYNQLSFEYDEKLSELIIILCSFSYILTYAENMEIEGYVADLDYKTLEGSVTNIIVYFLKFLSFYNPKIYEVAFKRCLTPLNLKYFHMITTELTMYQEPRFFDFDYKNFRYGFLIGFIGASRPLCEEITPGGKFRIQDHETMNFLLSLYKEGFSALLHLEEVFRLSQGFCDRYVLFSRKPEEAIFQRELFKQIFTNEQIKDLILFDILKERSSDDDSPNVTKDENLYYSEFDNAFTHLGIRYIS